MRLIHRSDPWPLAGHPEAMKMELPPRVFSHQCLEGEFCELRHNGVLRSSLPASNSQATPKIAYLSDTPAPDLRDHSRIELQEGMGVGLKRLHSLPTAPQRLSPL